MRIAIVSERKRNTIIMASRVDETTVPSYYYYVDPETTYTYQQPNPLQDLISVYGLDDISRQVARTNLDGTKAVKLRKSYKNQIADLSGKFSTIPTRENGKGGQIAHILFQNNPDMMIQPPQQSQNMSEQQWREQLRNRDIALFQPPNFDWDLCSSVLSQFERSYPSEFANQNQGGAQAPFDIDDLAFDLDGTGKSQSGSNSGNNSKKRKNKSSGSSMATPTHSDSHEDMKRRRLE